MSGPNLSPSSVPLLSFLLINNVASYVLQITTLISEDLRRTKISASVFSREQRLSITIEGSQVLGHTYASTGLSC